jgi:hypothetical protein
MTDDIVTDEEWESIAAQRARLQGPVPPPRSAYRSTPEGRANARKYYRVGLYDPQRWIPQWTEAEPQGSLKPVSRERYATDQAVAHACGSLGMMRVLNLHLTPKGYDGPDVWWPWKQPKLAEQLTNWRDPRNMQVYADPTLLADLRMDWRPRPRQPLVLLFGTHARPLTRKEADAGFSLMLGLADDRMVSLADDLALCDGETPTARAYQAAMKVLQAYYLDKRLKVDPAYLAAARIVVQCVDLELLLRDLHQKKRELCRLLANPREMHALAKGKWPRLSPGSFNLVSFMLAGPSQDAAASHFERDRSVLSESLNRAISDIETKFSWYCNDLAIPPEKTIRKRYNIFREEQKQRAVEPKVCAEAKPPIPDCWFAEALEYWGYWGDTTTKLPPGLAEDYETARLAGARSEWRAGRHRTVLKSGVNYIGERDYDSDPDGVLLIKYPQPAADWRRLISALPKGPQKSKLQDKNADIAQLLSDFNHQSDRDNYLRGDHRWTSKAVPPARPNRRPPGIRSPNFCGPIIEINGKIYPRAVVHPPLPTAIDVVDVVDRIEISQTREDGFCFSES